LKFPDKTQVRVKGLVEIMADIYTQGRPANEATAGLILDRLEAQKNYIPSSDRIRREYVYALLREYRTYIKDYTVSTLER
jgi:hypothetical protein